MGRSLPCSPPFTPPLNPPFRPSPFLSWHTHTHLPVILKIADAGRIGDDAVRGAEPQVLGRQVRLSAQVHLKRVKGLRHSALRVRGSRSGLACGRGLFGRHTLGEGCRKDKHWGRDA